MGVPVPNEVSVLVVPLASISNLLCRFPVLSLDVVYSMDRTLPLLSPDVTASSVIVPAKCTVPWKVNVDGLVTMILGASLSLTAVAIAVLTGGGHAERRRNRGD